MLELTPDEARVIGVLIEKDLTTPDAYPLTLNAVVNGANQRNNRDPVTSMTDDAARSALVGLRGKGLVIQLDGHGQRTSKFKHDFMNKLGVTKSEMVVLAELMLRGPQTQGELRGRASRMYPLESLDMVRNVLQQLIGRPEPMAAQVAPSPGSRAERYVQLLCPDLHELSMEPVAPGAGGAAASGGAGAGGAAGMAGAFGQPTMGQRMAVLESEVSILREALRKLAAQIGADDPLPQASAADIANQDRTAMESSLPASNPSDHT